MAHDNHTWQAAYVSLLMWLCVKGGQHICCLQDPKRVVEHYAAGEGEGEAAPKVFILLCYDV